jgi:hypothetical protein
MRRYLDRRSVWMGFRNELGFRFAFAGTRDIFGDENDHHFEPIGVNLTSYGAVVLTSHASRFHVSCRVSDSAERDWREKSKTGVILAKKQDVLALKIFSNRKLFTLDIPIQPSATVKAGIMPPRPPLHMFVLCISLILSFLLQKLCVEHHTRPDSSFFCLLQIVIFYCLISPT